MGFDTNAFMAAQFTPRMRDYPVPQLKDFFDSKGKPVWKIRALTGAEIGNAEEAAKKAGLGEKMIEALVSINSQEVADEVKKLVGKTGEKPETILKRLYHLHYASVEPECPFELAVRLCDEFSVLFLALTNAILLLSDEGNIPGKLKPSGKTKK